MNFYREESSTSCYFHPKEEVVGVCALCLRERLVILASKQGLGHHHHHLPLSTKDTHKSFRIHTRKPIITFNKVFALGSFLHRLDFKQHKSGDNDDDAVDQISNEESNITSLEDSFISIKFEENGRAMWDNKRGIIMKEKKEEEEVKKKKKKKKSVQVVEHNKQRSGTSVLRWRKRIIGHLLQLARWKRSTINKPVPCHVGVLQGKLEGRRSGWMRSLTRRSSTRTTTTTTTTTTTS